MHTVRRTMPLIGSHKKALGDLLDGDAAGAVVPCDVGGRDRCEGAANGEERVGFGHVAVPREPSARLRDDLLHGVEVVAVRGEEVQVGARLADEVEELGDVVDDGVVHRDDGAWSREGVEVGKDVRPKVQQEHLLVDPARR